MDETRSVEPRLGVGSPQGNADEVTERVTGYASVHEDRANIGPREMTESRAAKAIRRSQEGLPPHLLRVRISRNNADPDSQPASTTYAELLADAAGRAPGNEVKITIREFIGHWEARRRGSWVIERIQMALDEYGLATVPSFENGWIDNTVVLFPLQRALTHPGVSETADLQVEEIGPTAQVKHNTALRFADLTSADGGITGIPHDTSVCKAQSLMIQNDFSQLPVVSGRELVGAVSWESISRARMHKPDATLRDSTVPAVVVSLDDEVLPHVSDIIRRGFVFVRRVDRTINGIVTTTDLSAAFERLAGPFLLVGDVERGCDA